MKILIIGSEGFIGKSCVNYFLSIGHEVYGCDLLDQKNTPYSYYKISRLSPSFDDIIKKISPKVCINAAGSGSVPLSIAHPKGDFEANTVDTFTLLDAIRRIIPSCRYVNLSSAAVYGNPSTLPISEKDSIAPMSPYGWHKFYSEQICKEFYTLYGIETCSIRPFSVYGPSLRKQLFWDLYQKSLLTKEIELFGTGDESRDFIFIDDLVNLIDLTINRPILKADIVNAANGVETTIKEVVQIFYHKFDSTIEFNFNNETRIGDPLNWCADISLAKSWGFTPNIAISKGLELYVSWLKNQIF
ncbi:MAG: NAD-dependent epimerase/dehydratase family protein [Cytophagales bacterium]|nr:MAG: NAD-dependent epimerase/dehydratase family protein [Cytophagales bacterium]